MGLKSVLSIALAAMPGDDLLFHRLSDSTIGAVWFHGRVRDGIGWVTDAMATKQWGQRMKNMDQKSMRYYAEPVSSVTYDDSYQHCH
jgi:hypothetical protein